MKKILLALSLSLFILTISNIWAMAIVPPPDDCYIYCKESVHPDDYQEFMKCMDDCEAASQRFNKRN